MSAPRALLPAAVHVFLLRNNDTEVYLIQRGPGISSPGMWSVPAGKLDEGERITTGAIREAEEEAGVQIAPDALGTPLIMFRRSNSDGLGRLYAFFAVRSWQGEPHNREPHLHSDAGWHPVDALPAGAIVSHIPDALAGILAGHTFIEHNWPA